MSNKVQKKKGRDLCDLKANEVSSTYACSSRIPYIYKSFDMLCRPTRSVQTNKFGYVTSEVVGAHLVQPGVGGVVEAHTLQHAVGAVGHQLLDSFHGILLPEVDHLSAGSHLRMPSLPLHPPWQGSDLAGFRGICLTYQRVLACRGVLSVCTYLCLRRRADKVKGHRISTAIPKLSQSSEDVGVQ